MGAIINIFKSIIGFITGLFSKKQPAATTAVEGQPVQTKQVKAPKAPKAPKRQKGKDGFYMEASAAEIAAAPPAQQSTKGKVGQAAAVAAIAAVATVAAAPKPVDAVELIRAAITTTQLAAQAESTASFAEMNAVPLSTGNRRRPGANMAGFLDMAKTARKR